MASVFLSVLLLVVLLLLTWHSVVILCEEENSLSEDLVPLVMWPGMGDSCCYVFGAAGYQGIIQRMLPQLYIKIIAFGKTAQEDSYNSFFLNTNTQVDLACELLSGDPKLKNGFNAMGFSQGAQLLRALVQRCDKVKIYNLLSVGGQHQGVYGFPFCMGEETWYCDLFRQFLSIGVYLTIFQDFLVQASYWHDPHDEESYQLDSLFLSDINQELKFNPVYKERLSNLSNFVLIKFEQDMMVQPRETQWFGFYKPEQALETYSLFESKIYTRDLLGLKYLHNEGRLHLLSSPNGHTLLTYDWLDNYVIPFIKRVYTNVHHPVDLSSGKKGKRENVVIKERKGDKLKEENDGEKNEKGTENIKNRDTQKEKDHSNKYTTILSIFSHRKVINNINKPSFIHIIPNGTVFVSGDKLIYQFDPVGNLVSTIGPFSSGGAHSIAGFGNQWLYVSSDNSIHRYSLHTGEYKGTVFELSHEKKESKWQQDSGRNEEYEDYTEIREHNEQVKEYEHRRERGGMKRKGKISGSDTCGSGSRHHFERQKYKGKRGRDGRKLFRAFEGKKWREEGMQHQRFAKRQGQKRGHIRGNNYRGKRNTLRRNGRREPLLDVHVSVDNQGLLYISQQSTGLIHVVTDEGHYLTELTIGSQPQKTQFDSKGHLRVIDSWDKNVYVLTKHNLHLRTYPIYHVTSPHGIFIDEHDNMLIADKEGGVTVYDDSGSQVHYISGFEGCTDVHVSINGILWVSDSSANKVYLL